MQLSDERSAFLDYSEGWNAKIQGKKEEARALFNKVVSVYPNTPAAAYAAIQIESLPVPSEKPEANGNGTPGKRPKSRIILTLFAFGIAWGALLLALFLCYRVMELEKSLKFEQALSTARYALLKGEEQTFKRCVDTAHKYEGLNNGAAFLEIEAALGNDDVNSALMALKRCPRMNEEVRDYLEKIRNHSTDKANALEKP